MFGQAMSRRIAKTGLALSALVGLAGLGTSQVSAAPIPGISSLQDLINAGQNGVVIGDKRFYNFSYIGSPTSGPNPAPTPAQISVAQSALPGGNLGLSFSYAWLSAEGFNQDSVIQYCVQVVPGTAGTSLIDGVLLNFNGTAPVTGGPLTAASVTETVQDLNGNTLGQLSTFDDGPGGSPNTDQTKLMLAPPLSGICVTKDIQVHSSPASAGGGVSTISIVDNTFHQVPEPASLGLIALGLPLLARRRRS